MKLKDAVNSIDSRKYSGIDIVEIGKALNISGIRESKLIELQNYFEKDFEVIKQLLNN